MSLHPRPDNRNGPWRGARVMDLSVSSAGVWDLKASAKPRVAIGVFHDVASLRGALGRLAETGCSSTDVILLSDAGALDGALAQFAAHPNGHAGHIQVITRNVDGPDNAWISADYDDSHSRLTRDQLLHFETWLASRFAEDLDGHLKRGGCLLICPTLDADQEQTFTNILLQHSADGIQLHDIRPAG